jgi:hypothetical protein
MASQLVFAKLSLVWRSYVDGRKNSCALVCALGVEWEPLEYLSMSDAHEANFNGMHEPSHNSVSAITKRVRNWT